MGSGDPLLWIFIFYFLVPMSESDPLDTYIKMFPHLSILPHNNYHIPSCLLKPLSKYMSEPPSLSMTPHTTISYADTMARCPQTP
jgi:hypothetical protein